MTILASPKNDASSAGIDAGTGVLSTASTVTHRWWGVREATVVPGSIPTPSPVSITSPTLQ